jgi:DNA-binding transcriptional regulator YiaG
MGRKQATFREGIGEEQRLYAQALRDVRSLRGETQQELGRLLGWSLSMVSRFEGATERPDRATRYDLKLWIGSGDGSAAYLPG